MTTLQQIDMPNALVLYAIEQNADLSEDSCWQLALESRTGFTDMNQVMWTHETIPKPTATELIDLFDAWVADTSAAIQMNEAIKQVETNSKVQASSIPAWASYTETEALAWHDTNVTNAIAPIANLTDAKAVLTKMATENRALVRMVIALRNKVFPDLEGN